MTQTQTDWPTRIRSLRDKLGRDGRPLSQEKFAALVDATRGGVVMWEKKWYTPSEHHRAKIAELEAKTG